MCFSILFILYIILPLRRLFPKEKYSPWAVNQECERIVSPAPSEVAVSMVERFSFLARMECERNPQNIVLSAANNLTSEEQILACLFLCLVLFRGLETRSQLVNTSWICVFNSAYQKERVERVCRCSNTTAHQNAESECNHQNIVCCQSHAVSHASFRWVRYKFCLVCCQQSHK